MSLERALDLAPLPTDSQGGFRRRIPRRRLLALVAVLFLAGRGFLQGDQQNAALIVSGYPGQVPLTQIYGRPYVAASRGSHKRLVRVAGATRCSRFILAGSQLSIDIAALGPLA